MIEVAETKNTTKCWRNARVAKSASIRIDGNGANSPILLRMLVD
ncbi:hypothetical protein HMPREF1584_00076 [Gardnerella vaginalis JCP8481A]|uniref:Uncharacterized protein n=1 Tax=Gardnerella vaginalis TaxID=2702 RepID=A0A133P1I8_GARVA|nr:hypothetical protein HMPREF1585_00307 [Gardnerella vaginalis JCP8481B]EPI44880.1 hypothetical protein HMPREF1584_00076 [Gardnerella vaginalis JCP8481A]KXA22401.1 hypothetical protein HMPREF3208_00311 [Gardnerella vaginalis]